MDGATFSPLPHHSWFTFRVKGAANARPFAFHMRSVAHVLSFTVRGSHRVRWIVHGRETEWQEHADTAHFIPADGEEHAFVTTMSPDFESAVFFLPRRQVDDCLTAEGIESPPPLRRILAPDDAVLRGCLARLAGSDHGAADLDDDTAARRLVLRLAELSGGVRPDWHADASVFDGRTMQTLVEYVDAHLRIAPSLAELALLVGLSPSHFAKKFRHSCGLSLQRFVNRRRLRAALETLKDESLPLVQIALDVGFSSQSHFTRLFAGLTGMTPARYRRQFRRTIR